MLQAMTAARDIATPQIRLPRAISRMIPLGDAVTKPGWVWDESLYRGSASYYAQGRLPYPPAMAEALRAELALDGRGRLLDVGCGPGSAALIFAPLFEQVVGIDADADMIEEAQRLAAARGVGNAEWLVLRAEELPAGLGSFRVATFAQSFHWMDRPRIARTVLDMLEPDGAWVHVNATTHQGAPTTEPLPGPTPPRQQIRELVHRYLGNVRRAGRGQLPDGTPSGEEDVMLAAGYTGPRRLVVPRGELFELSEDDIVASVYSLSSAAPHLFGHRRAEFEAELRQVLRAASPEGRFSERARDIELVIWRRPN
jgi:SAM-dependent methyltransferase